MSRERDQIEAELARIMLRTGVGLTVDTDAAGYRINHYERGLSPRMNLRDTLLWLEGMFEGLSIRYSDDPAGMFEGLSIRYSDDPAGMFERLSIRYSDDPAPRRLVCRNTMTIASEVKKERDELSASDEAEQTCSICGAHNYWGDCQGEKENDR